VTNLTFLLFAPCLISAFAFHAFLPSRPTGPSPPFELKVLGDRDEDTVRLRVSRLSRAPGAQWQDLKLFSLLRCSRFARLWNLFLEGHISG